MFRLSVVMGRKGLWADNVSESEIGGRTRLDFQSSHHRENGVSVRHVVVGRFKAWQ